ncbi:MAG: hypothetical protein H6581_28105 [Bacteroidia bacterium]|nr:hypothetical protein [Bacteroidia bacterium]
MKHHSHKTPDFFTELARGIPDALSPEQANHRLFEAGLDPDEVAHEILQNLQSKSMQNPHSLPHDQAFFDSKIQHPRSPGRNRPIFGWIKKALPWMVAASLLLAGAFVVEEAFHKMNNLEHRLNEVTGEYAPAIPYPEHEFFAVQHLAEELESTRMAYQDFIGRQIRAGKFTATDLLEFSGVEGELLRERFQPVFFDPERVVKNLIIQTQEETFPFFEFENDPPMARDRFREIQTSMEVMERARDLRGTRRFGDAVTALSLLPEAQRDDILQRAETTWTRPVPEFPDARFRQQIAESSRQIDLLLAKAIVEELRVMSAGGI